MIGNVLKEKRKALGVSQEEMALKIGMSRRYYGRIESNEELPSLSRLIDISKLLNMSIDQIISSEPEELLKESAEEPKFETVHKYLSHSPNGKSFCSAKCCIWKSKDGTCPGAGCMKEWQEQQRIKSLMRMEGK